MKRAWLLIRLALRNVRRHARRSVLTAAAMIIGLALMVFSRALGTGAHEDWIDSGVRMGSGHITLQGPGYQETGQLASRLHADALERALSAIAASPLADRVVAATRRLEVEGLAAVATTAAPVQIVGVDAADELAFSELGDRIVDGRFLEGGDRLQAVIGAALAERLNVGIGRRIVLTGQDRHGDIAGQLVRVVGLFRTAVPETDETLVYVPRTTVDGWLDVGDDVTTFAILLGSSRVVDETAAVWRDAIGDDDVELLTWPEAMPELASAVKIDDWGDYVFNGLLLAIVALAIVNTILMSVLYRAQEFAVLRALGLTRGQTGFVVFGEGMLLTALSGLVGAALGLAVTWVFFRNGLDFSFAWDEDIAMSGVLIDTVIVPEFRIGFVARSIMYVIVIGLVCSLYPAWYATRIDVADALKAEE